MKTKFLKLLVAVTICISSLFVLGITVSAESGTCGDSLTWSIEDGTLTISGTGAMTDYNGNSAPWYNYKDDFTTVYIGNGVTSIGTYAFSECMSLKTVAFEENSQLETIGSFAFTQCSAIENISLPNSVTSIETSAFESCSNLVSITIPDNITSLSERIFYACGKLEAVNIPSKTTTICDSAFEQCRNLTSVTFDENSQLETIGSCAFQNCSNLVSITLPDNITTINNHIFNQCIKLENVNIPSNITSISQYMFSSCSSLKTLIIPDNITKINAHAFYQCSGLTSITIPASVTDIGIFAFNSCSSLETVNVACTWDGSIFDFTTLNPSIVINKSHNIAYTADGNVISSLCSICKNDGTVEVTADGGVYNGTAKEAVITKSGLLENEETELSYTVKDVGTPIDAPVNAGTYIASVSCCGKTAVLEYTIRKAPVTITANSYTIKEDATLPVYTYDVAGLVNNETLPIDVSISCSATNSNTAGTYDIVVSGEEASTNYEFNYVNGTLIITAKEVQTITSSDVTMSYGETDRIISATTTGDGAITYEVATGEDVISVAADGTINVLKAGTATVTITASETADYAEATNTITVTVNKVPVTVTAKNYTIDAGEALPAFEYNVTGLVNGEQLPISVAVSCTADGYAAGTFDIIVSGDNESDNYTFTYTNGTLTVSNAIIPTPTPTPKPTPIPTPNPTTTPVTSENEPQIEGKNESKGWDAILDVIGNTNEGEKIVIDMNNVTKVPEDIFEQIAGQDIELVLRLDNGFTWTINGINVTNPKNVDMKISKGTRHIPVNIINSVTEENYTIQMTLAHNGDFGFTALLTIDLGKKNNDMYANLFWYDEKNDELVLIDLDKIENGKAELAFTHASDWAVVISEDPLEELDDVSSAAGIEENSDMADFTENTNPFSAITLTFAGVIIFATVIVIARKRNKQ